MSGPGPGPGHGPGDQQDHYYYHYSSYSSNNTNTNTNTNNNNNNSSSSSSGGGGGNNNNSSSYRNGYSNRLPYAPQLSTIPARRPVGAPTSAVVNPSQVSPSELAYPLHPAPSVSSTQTRTPQRMGTISSGGVFTVSPASSIHEEVRQDDEACGDGGRRGPLGTSSPSPPQQHCRSPEPQLHGSGSRGWDGGGWEAGQAGLWHGAPTQVPQAQTATTAGAGKTGVAQPTPTTYGPAPTQAVATFANSVLVAAPLPFPAPAPVHTTTAGNGIIPGVPAHTPLQQQQTRHQQTPNSHQETTLANSQSAAQAHPTTTGRPNPGSGPFMHYEDVTYLTPPAAGAAAAANGFDEEPKDETQVEVGVPHADTFPPVPPELNRPEARRSWDRQRKRRRKQHGLGPPNGDGGGGHYQQRLRQWRNGSGTEYGGERGGGRGCTAFLRFCNGWLVEMLCCLLSVVCLAVVVAVLKTYNGRSLSDWPLAVSLNTLVAFLAAICQVALAVPLTEGLGQLKWNSFARGEKPLEDFVTFENARRWPVFGSTLLLWRRKGRCGRFRFFSHPVWLFLSPGLAFRSVWFDVLIKCWSTGRSARLRPPHC
ncbi:hypothetical protein MYCTH_2296145 [Thermothelomyces thermophilus ATCC 42464]|uniref:Uncharacterized protein n=1 Tax=Thermothelomyces thermophilus (strain ATCC 42464 / BCRC 31852 / DSM 1799) TaxID=573729 RepID=G2Q0J8_THET4|nr:uncharacterized protein MYCTH_2296145 [Thermothelomyces thermophilus ATCC 42464]AEO54059.1 hypothetical protein MYCTH_2296145 [Thermothelomyces thermophilus ATCC 42464]